MRSLWLWRGAEARICPRYSDTAPQPLTADKLDGDPGQNTLKGGPGADTFVLADLGLGDLITDYSFAEGDQIDFTILFSADGDGSDADPNNNQLSDFVQLIDMPPRLSARLNKSQVSISNLQFNDDLSIS